MFGIGWTEFVVIAFVLLIFVGPKHLPDVLRKAGMIINELKNASRELRHQVTEEVRDLERTVGSVPSPKSYIEELGREFTDTADSPYAELREAEASVKDAVLDAKDNFERAKMSAKDDEPSAKPTDVPDEKVDGATAKRGPEPVSTDTQEITSSKNRK